MLLALRNEKGTVATGYAEYAVAGAVLAESLLDGRISVDDTRKHLVTVHNAEPAGDPSIDECLQRVAIFTDSGQIDPRTVVLISLANGSRLLAENFGRKEIRSRKERIEQIVTGELTGKATREVIAACEAAVMVAIIMPTIMRH